MSEVQKILENLHIVEVRDPQGYAVIRYRIDGTDQAEQALYTLLMEKMPKEITERETTVASLYPGHAQEVYDEAQGHNRAVKQMVLTLNELFGRTE